MNAPFPVRNARIEHVSDAVRVRGATLGVMALPMPRTEERTPRIDERIPGMRRRIGATSVRM
jgi:hypothetical protein